jgi:hypothetical protein
MPKRQVLLALVTMLCWDVTVHSVTAADQRTLSASELKNVPESVSFGKAVLGLSAHIWRDFMPRAVSRESDLEEVRGGRPQVALMQLTSQNGIPLPSRFRAEVVWIVQADLVWETKPFDEKSDEARYQFVIRDGPKLQPGSYVDVVVRLVDEKGTTLNLALRHQGIQAVS